MAGEDVLVTINGNSQGLQAALASGAAALDQFGAKADDASSQAANMSSVIGSGQGNINSFAQALGIGSDQTNLFGQMVNSVLSPLEAFASRIMNVVQTMLLWRGISFVGDEIANLDNGLFGLNNTMERLTTTWKYMYGTGNNAPSTAIATGIANWTKSFSIGIPFTRQDLLQAINNMAMVEGNYKVVEKYMSTIADIAATRTNFAGQPLDLNQASYALVQASMGYSRMLKYTMKLDPNELKKYGWADNKNDPNNFQHLLEALARYNAAHHITGAAKDIAYSTFFGEKSSLIDRLQNLELEGGGAMFKGIEKDLFNLNTWLDANQKSLYKLADAFGTTLAGGVHNATDAFKDFFYGFQNAGQGQFQDNAYWLNLADAMDKAAAAYAKVGDKKDALQAKNNAAMYRSLAHSTGHRTDTVWSEFGGIGADLAGIGGNLLGGLFMGLSQSDALGGLRDVLREIRDILGSPLLRQGAGALGAVAGMAVGEGLHLLATILGAIAGVVDWLSAHAPVAHALLLLLAGVIAVNMVEAMVAWAMSMVPVVAELAAIEWPIWLVIAVIAALAFGIYELVQHWAQVKAFFSNLGSLIGTFFSNLGTAARSWGQEFIDNFLGGMKSAENKLLGEVSNVAQGIKNRLGHSKPSEGPLVDDDVWGLHFMQNLANAITQGTPMVIAASTAAANGMAGPWAMYQNASSFIGGAAYSTSYGGSTSASHYYGLNDAAIARLQREEEWKRRNAIRGAIGTPGGYGRSSIGV